MASATERYIAEVEAELAKANEEHEEVSGEKALIDAKLSALPDVKKIEADRKQLRLERETCTVRLIAIEAEQRGLQVALDALRKGM